MATTKSSDLPPFHRCLNFYSSRSPDPDTETIRFYDSLTGHLALGFDFPVALAIALGRHVFLHNVSFFSPAIHVPSVRRTVTPLDGVPVDEKASYTCSEIIDVVRRYNESRNPRPGFLERMAMQTEAIGLWSLAADVKTNRISGADLVAFQRGTLFEELVSRRRDNREQVLPLWRGGPISVVGHSWVVGRLFGVRVYEDAGKSKDD